MGGTYSSSISSECEPQGYPCSASTWEQDWHSGTELNDAAKAFHDKYARQPRRLDEARIVHKRFLDEIELYLRSKDICSRIEYTGSSYEGVKVAKNADDDDLEFDVMIIMKDGSKLIAELVDQGHALLKPRPGMKEKLGGLLSSRYVFGGDEFVDAKKVNSKFFGKVQSCINESSQMNGKVRLINHGPATQMDVHLESGIAFWGPKFYSVDIVPAFEVSGSLYVAKPLKNQSIPGGSWRQSFSVEEKRKLESADRSNGCRKQVFRILKVIRNREPGLSSLTSYHLKTALFTEMDRYLSWTRGDVGKRLMGVLIELEKALSHGSMQHYYIRGVDLLSSVSETTVNNMRDRIARLITNKNQMMKILTS